MRAIVYLCKYFPHLRAFSLMRVDYRVYARASRHSRLFLAYTGAHQVENNYKDELYLLMIAAGLLFCNGNFFLNINIYYNFQQT